MADNLTTFMCRLSRNSGCHNFLEACKGVALPFTVLYSYSLAAEPRKLGRSYSVPPTSQHRCLPKIHLHLSGASSWQFATDFLQTKSSKRGHAVAQLVEALRYKPEGRGFDSRWSHWLNPSGRTMALGLTEPLNRNEYQEYFLGRKGGRCVGLTNLPT
jgi:hypothetical protein